MIQTFNKIIFQGQELKFGSLCCKDSQPRISNCEIKLQTTSPEFHYFACLQPWLGTAEQSRRIQRMGGASHIYDCRTSLRVQNTQREGGYVPN